MDLEACRKFTQIIETMGGQIEKPPMSDRIFESIKNSPMESFAGGFFAMRDRLNEDPDPEWFIAHNQGILFGLAIAKASETPEFKVYVDELIEKFKKEAFGNYTIDDAGIVNHH